MSENKDRSAGLLEQQSDFRNNKSRHFKDIELSDGEDNLSQDEFICPACCCGIYIEVKEECD